MKKSMFRLLSLLGTVAILVGSLSIGALFTGVSAATTTVWDGTQATAYAGGTGTEVDPYLIENGGQLRLLVGSSNEATNGKYYKLTQDIYLNNVSNPDWQNDSPNAWATGWTSFSGTLDGDGHVVYGLYSVTTTSDRAALFPTINTSSNVTIKNIGIENGYMEAKNGIAAGLIGAIQNGSGTITISQCYVNSDVVVNTTSYQGGLIGYLGHPKVTIENCYSLAQLKGTTVEGHTGAIIGYADGNAVGSAVRKTYGVVTNNTAASFTSNSWDATRLVFSSVYGTSRGSQNQNLFNFPAITVLTVDQMQGTAAKTNMSGLGSWTTIWKVNKNGYPTLRAFMSAEEIAYENSLWDGQAAAITEGDGSAENPYLIENGGQLYTMVTTGADTADKYYKITKDIYLNDVRDSDWATDTTNNNWPMAKTFYGNLDGDGHVVYGLYSKQAERIGLLPQTGGTVTVKNVGVDKGYLEVTGTGDANVAALVGYALPKSSLTVEQCYVGAEVTVHNPNGRPGWGALIGTMGFNWNAGAVDCAKLRLQYCYSLAKMTGKDFGASDSWGLLVGRIMDNSAWIKYSYAVNSNTELQVPIFSTSWPAAQGDTYFVYCTVRGTNLDGYNNDLPGKRYTHVLTTEQMQGAAAATNMVSLDFNTVFYTTDSYPALRVFQVGKLSLADSSAAVYCEKATGNTYMTDADKGNYGAFRLLGNYATADGDAAKIIPEGADGTAYKVVERGIIMGKGTRTEMDLSKAVGYVNLKQAGEDTSAATCYYVLSKTENFDNCWTLDKNGKLQYSLLVERVFNTAFDTDITFRPYVKVRVGGADYTLYAEARTVTYRQLVGLAQKKDPKLNFGWMN